MVNQQRQPRQMVIQPGSPSPRRARKPPQRAIPRQTVPCVHPLGGHPTRAAKSWISSGANWPAPTLLAGQPLDRHRGHLVRVPVDYAQGQGIMHQKPAPPLVVDRSRIGRGDMGVETQGGGVFHQQILPRGLACSGDPLRVRSQDGGMGDVAFGQQTVGGPQIHLVGKGAGPGTVRVLGQNRGHGDQAGGTAAVTDLDVAHFLSRPKSGGTQEVWMRHILQAWQVSKSVP
jgi:hypothetical protein